MILLRKKNKLLSLWRNINTSVKRTLQFWCLNRLCALLERGQSDLPGCLAVTQDILAVESCPKEVQKTLRVTQANVMSYRGEVKTWMQGLEHQVICLQETHVLEKDQVEVMVGLEMAGYQVFVEPAFAPGKGSMGGLLIAAKRHLNFRKLGSFMLEGKGVQFVVARFQNQDLVIGNVYLLSGGGVHHPTNARILGWMAAQLAEIKQSYLVVGDWNVDAGELANMNFAHEVKGVWACPGQATVLTGNQWDFGLASRHLPNLITTQDELGSTVSTAWCGGA